MTVPTAHGTPVLVSALLVGALAGVLGAALTLQAPGDPADAETTTIERVRDYTPSELEVACLPFMRETATSLELVQTRVSALEIRIRDKEDEIRVLETVVQGSNSRGEAISSRLEEARTQLTGLESELQGAVQDKADLLAALKAAREELAGTRMELAQSQAAVVEAREEALDQRWTSFMQDAKLKLCALGAVERVERCREIVDLSLAPHKKRFKACIRSEQATPELRTALVGEELPEAAAWLSRDWPETKEWYLLFCDPDLPEAGNAAPPRDPRYKPLENFD